MGVRNLTREVSNALWQSAGVNFQGPRSTNSSWTFSIDDSTTECHPRRPSFSNCERSFPIGTFRDGSDTGVELDDVLGGEKLWFVIWFVVTIGWGKTGGPLKLLLVEVIAVLHVDMDSHSTSKPCSVGWGCARVSVKCVKIWLNTYWKDRRGDMSKLERLVRDRTESIAQRAVWSRSFNDACCIVQELFESNLRWRAR